MQFCFTHWTKEYLLDLLKRKKEYIVKADVKRHVSFFHANYELIAMINDEMPQIRDFIWQKIKKKVATFVINVLKPFQNSSCHK